MGWPVKEPSVIYAIRCKVNGKVYIGCTYRFEQRIKEHFMELRRGRKRSSNSKGVFLSNWQEDFNKYGEAAFEVYIIKTGILPANRDMEETAAIAEYNATNPEYGYNKYRSHLEISDLEAPVIIGKPPKRNAHGGKNEPKS